MPEIVKAKLTGVAPLLMHNGQLADPTNKWVKAIKAITSIRKKTEEHHMEIKKLEWFGSLYTDETGKRIVMPADLVLAVVLAGAKKNKNGQEAKAGVYEAAPFFSFDYEGPKDPEKLWEDGRFCDYRGAVCNRARVMRSRPIFRKWSTTIELLVDTEIIDVKHVVQAINQGGERVGLGDWRPRFGRFSSEVIP